MTFFLDVLQQTLYEQTPMRTALLTWEFHGLDLIVLADESYHGQERAMKIMKQLNSDRYIMLFLNLLCSFECRNLLHSFLPLFVPLSAFSHYL